MSAPLRSTAGVIDALRRRVPEDELAFTYARSGGPGGQNVNKLSTRVTLWFDLEASVALSIVEKRLVRARLPGRIGRDGRLRVMASRFRTQAANRRAAIQRFYELLAAALTPAKSRKPTQMPRTARERRLREKQHRSRRKQERSGDHVDQ